MGIAADPTELQIVHASTQIPDDKTASHNNKRDLRTGLAAHRDVRQCRCVGRVELAHVRLCCVHTFEACRCR